MSKELLYNQLYERTKDFGRNEFVKELMRLERGNKQQKEQLQQREEVIEEIKKYIENHSVDTYEREYSMFEKCIPLDLLDILNKYKKEESE